LEEISSPLALMRHPSPLSVPLSLSLVWLPKGYVVLRATPPLHDEVLQEFWIGAKPIYFRNLGWIRDPEGVIMHITCTSTMRCYTCGTKSLRQCVALVSWHQDLHMLHHVHHQRLCGSIIPAFGLRGYISKSPIIVIALLLDRSWAMQGCVGNIFLLFAPNPNNSYIRPIQSNNYYVLT
jgi:hypothetical protein